MATEKKSETDPSSSEGEKTSDRENEAPAWAEGLKELYDSVVDEPLPDSFLELLEKFDEEPVAKDDDPKSTGQGSTDTPDKSS